MSKSKILILITLGLMQILFQNCGIRLQTFKSVDSKNDQASASPQTPQENQPPVDYSDPEPPLSVTKLNNLENIRLDIPDNYSKNIFLDFNFIKQSVINGQSVYQELFLPGVRVKKSKDFSLSKLRVEIRSSLLKSMVTSDSVPFAGGAFGDLTIAYKPVSMNSPVQIEMTLSDQDEFQLKLHDLRLELSGFLMGDELKYGTAFYKIDYFFPELGYSKSTIVAIHVYKSGTGDESELAMGSGRETRSDDFETSEICKTDGAQIVKWESENSLDQCSANISGLIYQIRPYGWQTTDYLKVGQSIQIRGNNSLKFLSSGVATTEGSAVLKCSESGWILESKSCKNTYSIDSQENANRLTFDYNQGAKFFQVFIERLKHE